MISIRRLLDRHEDDPRFLQVVSLLLEKIGSQAVQVGLPEYRAFSKTIDQLRQGLSLETLLMTAGSSVQAMADYNYGVSRFVRNQGNEIKAIVSMLTETVGKIGGGRTRSGQRFQEIADAMEQVAAIEDLQSLKLRLRDCLQEFHDDSFKQKAEMESVIGALQQQIERRCDSSEPLPGIDPATGLPRQDEGQVAMLKTLKTGARGYLVTIVVGRMQSINARFGNQAGDQVLRTCSEMVKQQLLPGDRMFRWAGPAVVLLLERAEPLEVVRVGLKRMLNAKTEATLDLEGRSVMIPISISWSAIKLISPIAIAVRQIETFIAAQSPRDFS